VAVPRARGEPAVDAEKVAAGVGDRVAVGVELGIARAVWVDCAW
jgi:hypothetical protein